MGLCCQRSACGRQSTGMRALVFVALALCVVVAMGNETYSKGEVDKMSKEDLVSALMKIQKASGRTRSELESARKQIRDLHNQIAKPKPQHFDEKHREMRESSHKAAMKKKHDDKKRAKLAKKEKLSDILMDHGAKFMAMHAAKNHKDEHSDKQMKKVLAAAKKGGRAGAVGPLKKVARAAAVAAVKKTRAALKKSKKHTSKHKLRTACLEAAKTAVRNVLKEQDALIEKAAKKWARVAIKKYPAAIAVSEHPDKPNVFVAPPMVHLSLTGGAPAAPAHKEVKPLKKHKAAKKAAKKPKKMAKKKTVKKAKKAKKVPSKKVVAKAAAKAKAKAGEVVKEK